MFLLVNYGIKKQLLLLSVLIFTQMVIITAVFHLPLIKIINQMTNGTPQNDIGQGHYSDT